MELRHNILHYYMGGMAKAICSTHRDVHWTT
jgi:hypothetical protein